MPKYKFTVEELQEMYENKWLTDRERIVFDYYYRRGLSIEFISAELFVSRSTVNSILKNIRLKTIKKIKT